MIGPDPVNVEAERREAATFVNRMTKHPDWADTPKQMVIDEVSARTIANKKWWSRRQLQRPFVPLFCTAFLLSAIFWVIRKDPYSLDTCLQRLPRVMVDRIPLLIGRWRLTVEDKGGREIVSDLYRTACQAATAGRRHRGAGKITLSWDCSGHIKYRAFREHMRKSRNEEQLRQ